MLVRPHPAHTKYYAKLRDSDIIIWPKEGALPQEEATQRDFYNSIIHSTLTVGINTSGMIDAILLGKPCVTVMTGQYLATQRQAVHFNHLLDADVLQVTHSTDEALEQIGQLMSGWTATAHSGNGSLKILLDHGACIYQPVKPPR